LIVVSQLTNRKANTSLYLKKHIGHKMRAWLAM